MDINKLLGIKMVNGSLDDEKGGTRNLIHGNGCEMPKTTKFLLETCTTFFGVAWDAILSLHRNLTQLRNTISRYVPYLKMKNCL